jgi:hypothetical protein
MVTFRLPGSGTEILARNSSVFDNITNGAFTGAIGLQ